jgi:osmoprotectant transport system permease protein
LAALLLLILAAATGWFDDLSLAREWASRRDVYAQAFGQHMALVGVSLALSIVIGVPLGIVAARDRRASARIFDALNIFQTIPSIALFGLLIGPLTALSTAAPLLRAVGVNGIGFTPAVIALVLYALLPVARNTDAAVRSIPMPLIESARAMGMAPLQILFHVTLPLALPILLAGLRIVVVQLIGLAVVAALIGAGGFGSFVFVGLGQTATDLVLLGALSAIAVAMIADALLRLLSAAALARVQS